MKKLFLLVLLFSSCIILAQENKHSNCATDEHHLHQLKENREYKKKFEANNIAWQNFALKKLEKKSIQKSETNPVTLSVVFHDLSSSSTFLLASTAPILDYSYIINKLNLIYDGTNLNGTPGNNSFINFCIAQKDVNGNAYTTAMSQVSGLAAAANLDKNNPSQLSAIITASNTLTRFPTRKYINVYIVDNIDGAAGFATLPSSHGDDVDGIYITRAFLMNNGSLNTNMNVLAHEMGHYLGLFHTFGICDPESIANFPNCSCDNNNCLFNGDMVCDTQPNKLQMDGYSCTISTFPNTCIDVIPTFSDGTHPLVQVPDPKQNFMDYGYSSCQYQFTLGQIQRMNFMIDPEFGPRKSLLGQSECVNCEALDNCVFSINPNVTFQNPRHEIIQISTGTPPVLFSPIMTCTPSVSPTMNYLWTLELLGNPNQIIFEGLAPNYTTASTLAPGNYRLKMTALLQSNSNCKETATYDFCIYPMADDCNLILPELNTTAEWVEEGWQRNSSENGWIIVGGNYPLGSYQYEDGETGFDNSAYDVIPLSPGQVIPGDPNFSSISLPTSPIPANIDKIIRVGKPSGGGGKAFYAKKTIQVTPENCKYRIWYLGLTEGDGGNIAYPFISNNTKNDAAFGWVCQYKYNSPVNTITTGHNTTIGFNDTNLKFGGNDMVSLNGNSWGFINGRTSQWLHRDIDFSEFVNLTPNTEITITFFAHSNIANEAQENAYGYYGIECLGGGTPSTFLLNIEDKSIPCSSPDNKSCTEIVVPLPQLDYYGCSTNPAYNFQDVKLYKKNLTDGSYVLHPFPNFSVNYSNLTSTYKLCLVQSADPFQEFKIVCKTLNTTIEDTFRVYIGFYNNLPDCTTGDQIDTTFHPGIINGNILVCGTDNLPSLHLTPTCILEPHTFQWYNGLESISGETNESLQLTDSNFSPDNCNVYYRKTLYKEPYCGNEKVKTSEEFHIYNNSIQFNGTVNDNDMCFGDVYELEIFDPYINAPCSIPQYLLNNVNTQNNLTFQMFDPISQQVIGNAVIYSFNGQIGGGSGVNMGIVPNPLVLTFNNINPATGNTPLFTPPGFNINLKITGTYLDCPVNMMFDNFQHVNFNESAIGGTIAYNCSTFEIDNVDYGVSYGDVYGWEYSTDGVFFQPFSAPTAGDLAYYSSQNPTLYIRRVSFGFFHCPNPAYSNVVLITQEHPETIIFNLPSSICSGSTAPILQTTSYNGVIGNWNVVNASNTASGIYEFTPLSGYCLPNYTYSLNVISVEAPIFEQIEPVCQGTTFTLPTMSTNYIGGTWSPAINDMQTTTYTFTPTTPPACPNTITTPTTMTVVVNPTVIPNFDLPSVICIDDVVPLLPTTSNNNIQGNWSPSVISNLNSGVYVFTPNKGKCAIPITKNITVLTSCEVTLEWGSDVSCQLSNQNSPIKFDEDIVDGPCIRVCENSTIDYTINGNTANIESTDWNVNGGEILDFDDTSCQIQWGTASYSSIQVILHYADGTTKQISRCIEKLNGPNALFGVQPDVKETTVTVCVDNTIIFDNLTTANDGNDNIYYNWNFGDETTSNEFEPTHIYTQTGNYVVTLTAYNGCSCVGSYSMTVHVEEGIPQIQCPTVVCEGERATYSLPIKFGDSCHPKWTVIGGTPVFHNDNDTQIDVIWDNVNESGFGTVTASASECFRCTSTIRVPVVKNIGTIVGSNVLCEKSQGLYSLPQWPTTEFNWTLDDGGTGATLIENNQRNEIIIKTNTTGNIILRCTYNNTLLGCGGTAEFSIFVKPTAILEGNKTTCISTPETYNFTSENNTITNINWIITGSNNFSESGSGTPFTFTFTEPGIYTISVDDVNYCGDLNNTIKVNSSAITPTAISGSEYICPGLPVTYSCDVPEGTIAHWEVQNGTIIGSSTGSEITVNFYTTATTPYKVNVWFEKEGCISTTISKTVTKEIPVLTFNQGDNSVCGSSIQAYTINPVNVDNYIWSISPATAGSIQNGQNTNAISILWNQEPGTAVVKVEVRKCGTTYSQTYNVVIMNHSEVSTTIAGNACLTKDFVVDFDVLGAGTFTSAVWDFGDGTPPVTVHSPITSVNHPYVENITASTTFNVTLTVFNAGGCSMPVVITQPVVVSPTPIIQLSHINDLNYCSNTNTGGDYTYTVNIQNGFGYTNNIQWFKNGAPFSTSASITVTDPGTSVHTYYAIVTNSLNCSATTDFFTVYNDCDQACSTNYLLQAVSEVISCQNIKVTPTVIGGSPTNVYWTNTNLPGATITQNNSAAFIAENVKPGEYSITLNATYNVNGVICTKQKNIPVTVPYKADIKYTVNCAGNNLYTLTLLDHSVFYPNTPIEHFAFTYDGGVNWYPGTVVGGIPQLTISLPPGNRNVGVKIWNSNYPACIKMVTLNLPAYPVATFTSAPSVCQREAIQFTATAITAGLQYHWSFDDGSTNLKQNPMKAFTTSGTHSATLKVTNSLGCFATHTVEINVIPNNIAGELKVNPVSACEGSNVQVYYQANPSTNPVQTLYWYHNEYTTMPFATTNIPSLTVNQSGLYFVYAENADGCMEYMNISPVSVILVPGPDAPLVTGPKISCLSESIHLDVPDDASLHYVWTLNGEPYQWNGDADVDFMPTVEGTYTFEVMAQIQTANGQWCDGATTIHKVKVVAEPVVPELELHVNSCSPYVVEVTVQNPQEDVIYYWSNGETGTTATITHDGPIQVRAEINGCSVTEQLDLPVDLETLAWIFPKGCVATCFEHEQGYIIGPLGDFQKWVWMENGNIVDSGNATVEPFYGVMPPNSYELLLETEYCETTLGTLNMSNLHCDQCKLEYTFKRINCVTVNNVNVYEIDFTFDNTSGLPLTINLLVPGGEGYFVTSTLTLPNGPSFHTLYFYPLDGFTGGTVAINIMGTTDKDNCVLRIEENLPNCLGKTMNAGKISDNLPKQNVVFVAPNPAQTSTTLHYQLVNTGDVNIELFDATGRSMWQTLEKDNKGAVHIDCEKLASGYYMIVVRQNGIVIYQSKLIIQ